MPKEKAESDGLEFDYDEDNETKPVDFDEKFGDVADEEDSGFDT